MHAFNVPIGLWFMNRTVRLNSAGMPLRTFPHRFHRVATGTGLQNSSLSVPLLYVKWWEWIFILSNVWRPQCAVSIFKAVAPSVELAYFPLFCANPVRRSYWGNMIINDHSSRCFLSWDVVIVDSCPSWYHVGPKVCLPGNVFHQVVVCT